MCNVYLPVSVCLYVAGPCHCDPTAQDILNKCSELCVSTFLTNDNI